MDCPNDLSKLPEAFKALITNQGLNYHVYDMLPVPVEIFAPDGTAVFANRAMVELKHASDFFQIVEQFNLKTCPLCIEILGRENMDKIFRGETCTFPDITAPLQNLIDRGDTQERPTEFTTMDLSFLPVWDGDTFLCTMVFFTVKNTYRGRDDIVKAQEYIRQHWLDEFDMDKTARAANLSPRHFRRTFKEVAGITPLDYYHDIKLEQLHKKLLDDTLSVEQVFADCGVDYRGTYLKLFKEKTGMTPSEYRKDRIKK